MVCTACNWDFSAQQALGHRGGEMAGIEALFAQLRAEAAVRGEDWLQRQLGTLLPQNGAASGAAPSGPNHTGQDITQSGGEAALSGPSHTGRGTARSRSSRPPRRYSPSPSPCQQRSEGGRNRAPSGPPAKRAAAAATGVIEGPAGGTRSTLGQRGGRPGGSGAAAVPARRVEQVETGPVSRPRREGSQITVASPSTATASHLQEAQAARGRSQEEDRSSRVTPGRKAPAKSAHGSRARRESESGPGPSAAGTELPGGSSSGEEGLCEDQSEGELSGSEEEVVPRTVPTARDSRRSADGIASTQPGKSFSTFVSNLRCDDVVVGGRVGGAPG